MIIVNNKELRNIQEQVEKNKNDIEHIVKSGGVLDEFGIKVVGEVSTIQELPTVAAYKEAHVDWEYGDAYAVGTAAPYTLMILTRANDTIIEDLQTIYKIEIRTITKKAQKEIADLINNM